MAYGESPGGDGHGGMNDRYNGNWHGLGTPQTNASTNYTGGQTVGKRSSTPAAPPVETAMDKAKAADWTATQAENRAAAQKKIDDDKKAADLKAATLAGTNEVNRLYGAGQQYGQTQLGNLGFADTYGLLDTYNAALNNAKAGVPTGTTADKVGSYFNTSDLWNNALNSVTNRERNKLNTAYKGMTGSGWQQGYIADTADDAILQSILDTQKGDVTTNLKNQLSRGQMSQGAYDYAMNQLGGKSAAAMADLQSMGGGVLSGYRGKLDTAANQFGDQLTGYTLGSNLNTNDLKNTLNTSATGSLAGLSGDLYKTLGDRQLFDIDSLVSRAGQAAGSSNTPLANAFTNQPTTAVLAPDERITGTTGAF
jgi:hypothetical protein